MLDTGTILGALSSHAMATGEFDEVNQHEPENAPSNGIACAIWPGAIEPAEKQSGLSSISLKFVVNVRLYKPWSGPFDNVDIELVRSVDALMASYAGGFTLDGMIKEVDFFGANGDKLKVEFGYQTIDSVDYRVATIKLPLIVNDVWEESQ